MDVVSLSGITRCHLVHLFVRAFFFFYSFSFSLAFCLITLIDGLAFKANQHDIYTKKFTFIQYGSIAYIVPIAISENGKNKNDGKEESKEMEKNRRFQRKMIDGIDTFVAKIT